MIRAAAATALLAAGIPCQAEIVALCGASEGRAYYPVAGLTRPDQAGWHDDSMSTGNLQLIRSGPNWDIVFTDSTGDTLSARGDGADITGHITDEGNVVLSVIYPRVFETYIFWLSASPAMVTLSQAKFATMIPKHGLMAAECQVITRLPVNPQK